MKMFSPIGFTSAFKTKELLGWKQTTQAEMEAGGNAVLPMEETELIHHSSSAIRRLISPPINLPITEKQQLKQQLTVKRGPQERRGEGETHVLSAHNESWYACRCQAVQHLPT